MKREYYKRVPTLVLAAGIFAMSGCSSSSSSTADSGSSSTADSGVTSKVEPSATPTTLRTPATGTSLEKAAKDTIYFCQRGPIKIPPLTRPSSTWVEGDAVVVSKIPFVEGSVKVDGKFEMTTTATERALKGNGLPNHPIGTFPVQSGTAAYQYYSALPAMGYKNAAEIPVGAYDINLTLPRNPKVNAAPTCIQWIFTGVVTQTGAAWHVDIAIDSSNNLLDPISALPMDQCWGHPYATQYHYHGYSWKCFPNQGEQGKHSPLFGYAIDGFGVFGPRGEDGKLVTNADLDECHGHTHKIEWDGEVKEMFHYHVNNEYPYSVGCYRGTPIELPHHLQH